MIQASNSEHGWLISAGISGAVQIALSILPVHSNIKTFYTLHSIISFASSTLILSSITNLLADQSSAPIITQNYTRILEPKSANYSNDATTIYDEHNTVNINTEVLTIEYE